MSNWRDALIILAGLFSIANFILLLGLHRRDDHEQR